MDTRTCNHDYVCYLRLPRGIGLGPCSRSNGLGLTGRTGILFRTGIRRGDGGGMSGSKCPGGLHLYTRT